MAFEDKARVLRRNLSATDRQQVIRTERFGVDIEKLGEMARRLRAKLENCYVEIKRYTVSIAAEEKKNPKFRKRTRRLQKVRQSRNTGRQVVTRRS
jgi:hypothetical protein